ncbi:MAG: cation transporter [Acidimicrobiia bacterium]|nr:cation transporter [Acidimicrobiia bacterium]
MPFSDATESGRSLVRAAFVVSVLSIVWTVLTGCAAVALGVMSGSVVLVAFGAVGALDALGSAALAHHFRHGLRHDVLSQDLERLAHRIVTIGLVVVGVAAVFGGVLRLWLGGARASSDAGTVVAGSSVVVLIVLARRKVVLARKVGSPALRSDGHLSAVGAAQAAVTLVGTLTALVGWHGADPTAAVAVGAVAFSVGVQSWRGESTR